jgi:hypothetical protein
MPELNFQVPGPVAADFMRSDKFVRGIRGPIGSAKTSACCVELFRRASQQTPDAEGIRPTRGIVVRNTQPELKTTTIKTWLDWFPEAHWGRFNWSPPFTHMIRVGEIELEMIFLALDNEEDVKKLYSLEATFGWINEARFVPKLVLDTMTERVGRFPAKRRVDPTWAGVIMDTNAMDPDHWWPMVAGEAPIPEDVPEEERLMLQKPADWEFFVQPPAVTEEKDENGRTTAWRVNPQAENLHNLPAGYYERQIQGKTRTHILRNVGNQLVMMRDGKAVHPSFSETLHLASTPLPIMRGAPVYMGQDFGLTPAAVFGQLINGQWRIQRELVSFSMGAKRFAEGAKRLLARDFPGSPVHAYGDPAGDHRSDADETTAFQVVRAVGIDMQPAPSNDPTLRCEAVDAVLTRLVDGRPAYLIDPSCRHLRKAMAGGYHYPKIVNQGTTRYGDKPVKNDSSHVAEAQQYMMLGAGEGKAVTQRSDRKRKATVARKGWNVMDRMQQGRGRYR